jgi:spore germination protein KC
MQKIKTVCKISLFLAMMVALTGCWDAEELEDNAYVIGLGLDRSEQEDKVQVTMLIANPEVGTMQGGGGSIEQPKEIITFDANDFIAAKSTANVIVSREISYELLRIIVVSEELAKEPDFFRWISNALTDKEIRLDTHLAVSKEKANEYFLKIDPKMETRPHKFFQFMITHGVENGLIPDSTLFRFFKTTTRGTDLFLAMYTTTKKEKNPDIKGEDEYKAGQVDATGEIDPTQFIGSAVFKDGVMIDTLNGQDTRTVNIFDDTTNIEDLLINIPDPFSDKQQIAVRMLKPQDNKVKMNLKGGKPKITITLPLQFEILTNPSMVNYAKDKKKQQELKIHIADHMKTNTEDFFKKTQTELKGVPYPLSIHSRKYFGTIQEYEKFNWNKSYLEADITVKPDVEIIDYGKQIKSPK